MDGHVITIAGANIVIASILVLALGRFLTRRVPALARLNIPIAVTGGLICSGVVAVLHMGFHVEVEFDLELRNPFLLVFFSTIGLSAKFSSLRSGGKTMLVLLVFAILLLILQDTCGVLVAMGLGEHPAYGLFAGSVSFAGGHGTAIAWGETAEQAGLQGAGLLGIACATSGLIAGGIIGGPIGARLIRKHGLKDASEETLTYAGAGKSKEGDEPAPPLEATFSTLLLLALCVALGANLNDWLSVVGVKLPEFLTAMFIGILLTNLADALKGEFNFDVINRVGEISLHLFLAMSLMSIQLAQLAGAFGPLMLVLIVQMLVITSIAVFLVFRFTGRDYDAAVIASGFLGLGLGATPVAMANMHSLTSRYGPSTKAFLVVPLVGAFFIDLSNAVVIRLFTWLPFLTEGLIAP